MKKHLYAWSSWFLFLLAVLGVFPGSARAMYSEQIAAGREEVYAALRQVMDDAGIEEENAASGEIVSRWQEDEVLRERQMPFSGSVNKSYARRYRVQASLKQEGRFTRMEISASFQYRPSDASRMTPWRELKNMPEERDVEKEFFIRVLREMEARRNAS